MSESKKVLTQTWGESSFFLLPQVALQKLYNFATSSIFETCVSGRMVADMCRAAAKVCLSSMIRNFEFPYFYKLNCICFQMQIYREKVFLFCSCPAFIFFLMSVSRMLLLLVHTSLMCLTLVSAVSSCWVSSSLRPSLLQRHLPHYWQSVPRCACSAVHLIGKLLPHSQANRFFLMCV